MPGRRAPITRPSWESCKGKLPRGLFACGPFPLCLDFWPPSALGRGRWESQLGTLVSCWLQALPRMSICPCWSYLALSVGTSSSDQAFLNTSLRQGQSTPGTLWAAQSPYQSTLHVLQEGLSTRIMPSWVWVPAGCQAIALRQERPGGQPYPGGHEDLWR